MLHWWEHPRLWLARWQRPLRVGSTLVGVGLFLLFLALTARALVAHEEALQQMRARLTWQTLTLLGGLYGVALAATLWPWGRMLGLLARPVPWSQHWRIYTTTNFTKRLPGSFWHVAGRAVLYHERGISRRAVAIASALEMALMLVSGGLVALALWPLVALHMTGPWQSLLLLLVGAGALGALCHPKSWRQFRQLSGAALSETRPFTGREALAWVSCYALSWLTGGVMVLLLAHTLYPLPWQQWPGVVGAWVLAYLLGVLVAVLPSGLGVAELSLTLLLAPYLPAPLAALVAIASRFLFTGLELLAGLVGWVVGYLSD